MRTALLSGCLLAIAVALSLCSPASAPAEAPKRVDFQTQVRPILAARCQPCHFAGGKMYARLPFDRSETIRTLGEKMFTRIKDEREVALIRSFLAQQQ
jgi:hypothetical protein